MLVAVLSGYLFALIAPGMVWAAKRAAGPLLAALPAFLFAYLLQFVPEAAQGRPWHFASPWDAVSGLELTFRADGLSLFLGLVTALAGTALLVATAGFTLAPAVRERLLLALMALVASSLGLVLADQPVLYASFSAALSLSLFLLVTAYEGEEGRARRLPLLIVWLLADLALLSLFARLFTDVPGGLLGPNGLTALPVNGRPDPGWIVPILALKLASLLVLMPRTPPFVTSALASLAAPSILALLFRAIEVQPFEARLGLGACAALGMAVAAFAAVGARRLASVFAALIALALCAAAFEIALANDLGLTAALLTLASAALASPALFLAIGTSHTEPGIADLGTGFLRAPLTSLAIALGLLVLCGVAPSIGLLAALTASKAAFAVPPWIAAPPILLALAVPLAVMARAGVSLVRGKPGSAPRARLAMIGPAIALALVAVGAGIAADFLSRALIAPAIKQAPPALFGSTVEGWSLIAAAAALAGLFYWQQKWLARALSAALMSAEAWKAPSRLRSLAKQAGRARVQLPGSAALAAASLVLVTGSALALIAGWPREGLAVPPPDMTLVVVAVIGAASLLLVLLQRRMGAMVPLLGITALVSILAVLVSGAVDLAFVLLLVVVLQIVILLTMRAREPAAPAKTPVKTGLRAGVALLIGTACVLGGLESAAPAALPGSASGITAFIDGALLRETGLAAIERWAGIILLLALLGMAATDLWRRREKA